MRFSEAKSNLIKLLCCSIENLSSDQLRKLVKKRYKLWHPDKNNENPDKFKNEFILLKESYNVYKAGPPASENSDIDIECDEEFDPSWCGDSDDSEYNSTPFDDDFFNASPKKAFAVPDEIRLFFRSKTNRRAGKIFMLFCNRDGLINKTLEVIMKLNFFKSFFVWSARTNKEIYCILIVTVSEYRLIDLKKILKKNHLFSMELFYAVNLFNLYDKLVELYKEPVMCSGEKIERKKTTDNSFNNKQLVDFAQSNEYTDVFTLMYEYAHLAEACDRTVFTKDHEDDHRHEIDNAKKFVNLPDRKRVCKNAIDCVIAKLYRQLSLLTNLQWLENRSRELSDRLLEIDDPGIFGVAYWYSNYVLKLDFFRELIKFVIETFTKITRSEKKIDKQRYLTLIGHYNCGKTTFAAALCKFFDGANINLNVCKDRLPFYLGAGIGKRFILFDDVKGYKTKVKGLPTGQGLSNLDDMREHLDGKIEVQLEKKNQNPVQQIFPCGVITMNDYEIPGSLKLRLKRVIFPPSPVYKKHKYSINMDTLYIAMVLDNLIPCEKYFIDHAVKLKDKWIKEHSQNCNCMENFYPDNNTQSTTKSTQCTTEQETETQETEQIAREEHPKSDERMDTE